MPTKTKQDPEIQVILAAIPAMKDGRWLISFDHEGKIHTKPVPPDACGISKKEILAKSNGFQHFKFKMNSQMNKKDKSNEVKDLLSQLRSAAEVIKKQIHEADQKIEALLNERAALSEARLTKEDFMLYVRKDIERRASDYPNRMKSLARTTDFPFNLSFPQLERIDKSGSSQLFPYLNGEVYTDGAALSASALYWIFGDQIEKRFSLMQWINLTGRKLAYPLKKGVKDYMKLIRSWKNSMKNATAWPVI